MTVFLAHCFADLDAAEALAKSIERRGLFVEHEDGERVGRALQANDAVVLLWSSVAGTDANRLLMERRALDAWAEDKLIVISLDRSVRPVGMRDLPAIDAAEPERWPAAWEEANAAIAMALTTQSAVSATIPDKAPAKRAAKSGGSLRGLGGLFLLIGLLGLIALAGYLYQRVQYAVFDLPQVPDWALWAGPVAVVALFWLANTLMRPSKPKPRRRKPGASKRAAKSADEDAYPQTDAVFVAYAPDDAVAVGPVVAAVEAFGRSVWIDKAGGKAGQQWSGEIVRSIRTARGVMVLCSPAAFQSDHVKREVYLADRYRKPLLPVFIKAATLPPDFAYFFAGVQGLDLVATPEPERPEALRVALAAV